MSEIVNIPLGGVSNEPNDYGTEEGGLSVALNAVKHHGSLRPVMPGTPVEDIRQTADDVAEGTLPPNTDVVAIHEVGNMKHYILLQSPEEGPAGARPTTFPITIHYLCSQDKVTIWWSSTYPDYFANSTLHLKVGVGTMWEWVQLPYNTASDVPAAGIAVAVDDSGNHMMYEYDATNPDRHISGACMGVLMIDRGNDDVISGDDNRLTVTYSVHYPKTTINITVHCLHDKIQLGYTAKGYWDVNSVVLMIGAGTKKQAIGLLKGQIYEFSNIAGLSVATTIDTDGNTVDVMYEHPTSVLTDSTVAVEYLLDDNGGMIPGFKDADGNIVSESFTVTTNVAVLDSQEEITTGNEPLFPSDKAEGKYTLYYIDATATKREMEYITKVKSSILGVSVVGNVLTVSAKGEPLNYIIWKDGEYHVLGSEMEAPKIYPYLISNVMDVADILNVYGIDYAPKEGSTELIEDGLIGKAQWEILSKGEASSFSFMADQQKVIGDKAFAIINSAHRNFSAKGYFWAPFYVRFAFRMFDGSHVMHTPPQLMIAGSGGKPILYVDLKLDTNSVTLNPTFVRSSLCFDMQPYENKWNELVTHLDIFVSPPLINYSDSATAISGAGVIVPTPTEESEEVAVDRFYEAGAIKLDDIYMKSRKQIGSVAQDFLSVENLSRFTSVTSLNVQPNVPTAFFNNAQKGRNLYGTFYLFSKSRYPDLRITTPSGMAVPLKQATPETKIGYIPTSITGTEETQYITLADTGLDNLDKYWYIETEPTHYYDTYIVYAKNDDVTWLGGKVQTYSEVRTIRVWSNSGDQITKLVRDGGSYALQLQRTDGNNYQDVLHNNNSFYLIHSIPIQELTSGFDGPVPIGQDILSNLASHQPLSDNGQMRSSATTDIVPFGYNNRLSMAVESWELPSTSPIADFCVQNEPDEAKGYYIEKAWIKAVVNGQVVYKRIDIGTDAGRFTYAENIRYFYYPCYDATELILQIYVTTIGEENPCRIHVYTLDKHKLLNGAYCFNNFDSIIPTSTASYANKEDMHKDETLQNAEKGTSTVVYGNMVRVSGVSNPFYFNETNQVSLPSGKISGLSTTSQALSQGQFGAFPLYCFSDNGIWALEVSDTGTYSAKQPVSRAVCTNPKSITQTEGQVLFVTKRGLMAISGSNTECVSEILSGHNYTNELNQLNKVIKLANMQYVPADGALQIPVHIEDWMQNAQFIYDDKRQFIYAIKEDDVLGYIYSMTDQAWGMFTNDIAHPLPSYTDALAVTNPNAANQRQLINLSDYDSSCTTAPHALVITRPLKLGMTDGYKTLEALITRGMLDKGDAKLVIWASNDLKTWAVIATSQTTWMRGWSGTPYKYFRFGLILDNWSEQDSVNGFSADITPRLNNRLR